MEMFFGVVISVILGFYILGKVLKFAFKIWIARKMSKFGQRQGDGFSGFKGYSNFNTSGRGQENSNRQSNRREGEIKVTLTAEEPKKVKEKVGEYIDFDEVK